MERIQLREQVADQKETIANLTAQIPVGKDDQEPRVALSHHNAELQKLDQQR